MKSSSKSLDNFCLRTFNDGRRCRMLLKPGHASLCIFHAREEAQLLETEKLAAELASLSGRLNNGTDINHVLAKVFKALSERRISAREAKAFAYLGQLLLQTLRYVRNETYWVTRDPDAYYNLIRDAIPPVPTLANVPSPAATLLAARRRSEKSPQAAAAPHVTPPETSGRFAATVPARPGVPARHGGPAKQAQPLAVAQPSACAPRPAGSVETRPVGPSGLPILADLPPVLPEATKDGSAVFAEPNPANAGQKTHCEPRRDKSSVGPPQTSPARKRGVSMETNGSAVGAAPPCQDPMQPSQNEQIQKPGGRVVINHQLTAK